MVRPEADAAARVVSVLLVAAILATALSEALSLWRLMRTDGPPAARARLVRTASPRAMADSIVGAHLFGSPPSTVASDAAPSVSTSWALTGTVASSDPGVGFALLGPTRTSTRFYAAGEAIAPGTTLRAVYADRVIIDREGSVEALMLPHSLDPASLQAGLLRPRPQADQAATPELGQEEASSRLNDESSRMAMILKQTPYFADHQLRGIIIGEGSSPGLLESLGLKPGDILHHVDGTLVLTPNSLGMLRERLATGAPVRVGVSRPGQGPIEVTLNTSAVAPLLQ
jgi:general secretion pathway protein C